eukprot:1287608-Pyramimonas_sp.AAC.1
MEDNQAVVKVCKAGGAQKLMHLPRTNRIDASAVAEQFARGAVNLAHCPTHDQAADIGPKRFEQPPSWVRALCLVQVAAPTFWTAPSYQQYMDSLFEGETGLPLKPGGVLKPKLGAQSELRNGGKIPSKKAKKKLTRQNKGKPPADSPPNPRVNNRAGTPVEVSSEQRIYRQRKLKEDRDMMALFEITD